MGKQFFFLLISLSLLFGCSGKKELFVLMPDPDDGTVGEITVANAAGKVGLNKSRESVQITDGQFHGPATVLSQQEVQATFVDALRVIPTGEEKYIFYFRAEGTELTAESKKQLPVLLSRIKKRIPCEVSIVGYTDTIGPAEYNQELSRKRAEKIKRELVAVGIPAEFIQITAGGENRLLIPTKDNIIEPKNRRVEISIR